MDDNEMIQVPQSMVYANLNTLINKIYCYGYRMGLLILSTIEQQQMVTLRVDR